MLLLGRRTADEKVAAFLLNLQARYGRIGAMSVNVPLPMSPAGHRRLSRPDHRNRQPHSDQARQEKTVVVVPDGVRLLSTDRLDQLAAACAALHF